MADQTPSQSTRRRVAKSTTSDPPSDPPNGSGRDESSEPSTNFAENRTEFGWPGVSYSPFVGLDYYKQFPTKFRPTFDAADGHDNLTTEQAKAMETAWKKPIDHITMVNVNDKEDKIVVLGQSPGERMWVRVPPFGIVRGPLQSYLNGGLAGSRFSRYQLIGPDYAALAAPANSAGETDRRSALIDKHCLGARTKPLVNNETLANCMLYGCPVEGHVRILPNGDPEQIMSLAHAYYWVSSIGQTLTVRNPETGQHEVVYTPDYQPSERDKFGPKATLDAFKNLDGRPNVHLFIGNRQTALERREQENRMAASRGRGRTGR